MTVRNRNWGLQLSVLLLSMTLCFCIAFFIFWIQAAPYCGERLSSNILAVAARYFPIAGVLLVVLCVPGVLWISLSEQKRIYKPLNRLVHAAKQISDGRLDYELVLSGLGEFSELGCAFEEMRVRLLDSIKQSEKSEAERLDVMNSICHDLKTPVTSILGYAEGILDGVADTPEKVGDYAGIIAKKARRMSDLVDGLNYLTVLENEPPLSLEPVDIGEWLEAFARELSGEARVELDIEKGLICTVDAQKLSRVFYNLVDNSLKYTKVEPVLWFTVRKNDDAALLSLLDNGPGLPPLETRKVFARFYRGDPSRSAIGGSGLGLSIARQIVSLLGGKIWLQNHKDGGLLASVSLPLTGENL